MIKLSQFLYKNKDKTIILINNNKEIDNLMNSLKKFLINQKINSKINYLSYNQINIKKNNKIIQENIFIIEDTPSNKIYCKDNKLNYFLISKHSLEAIDNFINTKYINEIEININDHCNLKCKSCSHYSNLAYEHYLDINIFEKDIKRISELIDENTKLFIFGGEPLLVNNIIDYLKILKQYLPNNYLEIRSNGILLIENKENYDELLNYCQKNNIVIGISVYPINDKYIKDLKNLELELNKVKIKTNFIWFQHDKLFSKDKRFLNKNLKINKYDYIGCIGNYAPIAVLKEGKIYHCPICAYIKYFNEYFKVNLETLNEDYIDIYQVNSAQEIIDFLLKPTPFCNYCDVQNRTLEKWNLSEFKIDEYI
ncbi:MAG: radical SAM protein [Bacilli bacterium]|nr:radical SAM protein [Bacilli bacterium]